MNDAIMDIGSRNRKLNTIAMKVAQRIGVLESANHEHGCCLQDAYKFLSSKKVQDLLPD
jgi:hypothetical protein